MSECNDLKPGDIVQCRDDGVSHGCLSAGRVYTISEQPRSGDDLNYDYVMLDGVTGIWHKDRFEMAGPHADWKPGDSVRCLDDLCSKGLLHSQHVYEIEQIGHASKLMCLVGVSGSWGFSRFERVSPIVDVHSEPDKPVVCVGSRVRCDDASESHSGLCDEQIYVVSAVDSNGRYIAVDGSDNPYWMMSRFTLLPDEVAPVVPTKQADQWDEATRGKKMSSATGRVIYKYQMPVMEHFTMQLPAGAEIIRMDGIDGMFWLWAVVDTNAADETRKFHSVKCGGNMPDIANLKYVGCCALFVQQELMLYIFEEVSNA